jgi:exoribonuclease II
MFNISTKAIVSLNTAYAVAERLNEVMHIGDTFVIGNNTVTKIDERGFEVKGREGKWAVSELGDLVLYQDRKAINAQIKQEVADKAERSKNERPWWMGI